MSFRMLSCYVLFFPPSLGWKTWGSSTLWTFLNTVLQFTLQLLHCSPPQLHSSREYHFVYLPLLCFLVSVGYSFYIFYDFRHFLLHVCLLDVPLMNFLPFLFLFGFWKSFDKNKTCDSFAKLPLPYHIWSIDFHSEDILPYLTLSSFNSRFSFLKSFRMFSCWVLTFPLSWSLWFFLLRMTSSVLNANDRF